jgi:hypothetical protein
LARDRLDASALKKPVGVAGAKWITNEVDKRLLRESVKVVAKKALPKGQSEKIIEGPPRQILASVREACESCE